MKPSGLFSKLTKRQEKVLKVRACGLLTKEAAYVLDNSQHTVEKHVKDIKEKIAPQLSPGEIMLDFILRYFGSTLDEFRETIIEELDEDEQERFRALVLEHAKKVTLSVFLLFCLLPSFSTVYDNSVCRVRSRSRVEYRLRWGREDLI